MIKRGASMAGGSFIHCATVLALCLQGKVTETEICHLLVHCQIATAIRAGPGLGQESGTQSKSPQLGSSPPLCGPWSPASTGALARSCIRRGACGPRDASVMSCS